MSLKITGKTPSGKHLEKLKQSPNYKKNAFQNISDTPMKPDDISYWKLMKEFIHKNKNTVPPRKLPSIKTDLSNLSSSDPVIVWFGHSSYLIRIENKNFLIDPVFSGNAAPLSFMIKAFPGSNIYKPEDMPIIDYLILTHDHYDHLDFKTVRKLRNKVKTTYCSLGVSSHLKYWGFDINKITEMDWWDSIQLDKNISLTAAPAHAGSHTWVVTEVFSDPSGTIQFIELETYTGPDKFQLSPTLLSQPFRMRTTDASQSPLNVLRLQRLFELCVASLHFCLPEFDFAQLDTQISCYLLTARLRECRYCRQTNE